MTGATPEAAQTVSAAGSVAGRVRHGRAREISFRDIGRKVVLFAAANAFVWLLLPWARTAYDSTNAFGLGTSSLRVLGITGVGWMVLLAGNVFEACPLLRQLGVVACGTGGLVFIGGGAGLRYMLHALVSVAVLVSAVAAALTFHPASLERSLASFQRAWNSGDLDRVARFFPQPKRDDFRTRLGALVRRFDPRAEEGRTRWLIALASSRRKDDETTAAFILSPPGEDPFRARGSADGGRRLSVLFRREDGGWWVRAVGANVRFAAAAGPDVPADLDEPPAMPVPIRPPGP